MDSWFIVEVGINAQIVREIINLYNNDSKNITMFMFLARKQL